MLKVRPENFSRIGIQISSVARTRGGGKRAAGLAALERRASLLAQIRGFFAARAVLELEVPLLGRAVDEPSAYEALDGDLNESHPRVT